MESVIIVAPPDYEAALRKRLQQVHAVISETAAGGIALDGGNSRVYIHRDGVVRDELEPDRLASVDRRIPNPAFYAVDFSDIAFCRLVLEAVADDETVLVDNDHGVVLTGREFIRLMRVRVPIGTGAWRRLRSTR